MYMRKNLVLSIIGLLIVTIIGGMYVYREFNRRNPSVSETPADFSISAAALIDSFSKDSTAANTTYLGKIIEVTGFVKSIDKDAAGGFTLTLGDPETLSSVRCSMDSDTANFSSQKITGTNVILKGVCTGFMPDDMGLGSDVILNRSVIELKSSFKN